MLPLFPLPNVVLFPGAYLPLHIFEYRYRAMVRDVLAGGRMIGMVVLRDGWQSAPPPAPPIYATGCAGEIVQHQELPDGRFNIVLRGRRRFRIREEQLTRPYREAGVEWLDEAIDASRATALRSLRRRLDALLLPAIARGDARVPASLSDEDLVNAVCQALDIDIVEKQALLEAADVVRRAERLVDRLELLVLDLGGGQAH